MKIIFQAALFAALLVTATACQRNEGPVEKAGHKVDKAIDNAGDKAGEMIDNVSEGQSPLHKKGPAEKAGEEIDKAVDGKP